MEDEKVNKSLQTQLQKYGGKEGLSEEMKRRRALAKGTGFAGMSKERVVEIAREGGLNSRKNKNGKENPSSEG